MDFIRKIFVAALMTCCFIPHDIMAQENLEIDWSFGVTGGFRSSHMSYSKIDKSVFPESHNLNGGVFSVFAQGEFGEQKQYGIRPQISFLKRGGELSTVMTDSNGMYSGNYFLKAGFMDFRIPLMYNFLDASSALRPYVYFAPVLGFATGGDIKLEGRESYYVDVTKANMASAYFAGQIGVGVKYAIPIAGHKFHVGIEAGYEIGLTDTYSRKEKTGEANNVASLYPKNYKITGKRRFSGLEVQAVITIPFSIFKAKKKAVKYVQPISFEEVKVEQPIVVEKEKPCYTLDEIIEFMTEGKNVEGKTICAVDAIHFDFSKSTIKPESYDYLNKLAITLIKMDKHVEVKGHTDDVGALDFNLELSKKRAQSVVEYLVKQGVSRDKLTYSYYGESKPLVTNSTAEGRALNRRVEFTIHNN